MNITYHMIIDDFYLVWYCNFKNSSNIDIYLDMASSFNPSSALSSTQVYLYDT